jgi:Na+-driven multidrug efflux pump
VWQLAWPAVLTMLLQLTHGLVDMFCVGRLRPAAQAAVGWETGEVIGADEDRRRARLL